MIDKEDGVIYIATISGGKDSVTMCDLLLRYKYPVDYIVFNDTLDEYEEMYEYLDKIDAYFTKRYKIGITRTKPSKTYKEYIYHIKTKGDNIGKMNGLPNASMNFCEWRGISKRDAFNKFTKKFKKIQVYVGITTDEQNRTNRDGINIYPLVDDFKMNETDCKKYLIDREMENPLYRHFNRTGCAKCQFKSDLDWYNTFKHYPKVWEKMKELENKMQDIPNAIGKNWFRDFKKCEDMEKIFLKADKQGSLFDFSDEPLKDCFCKI